MSEKVSSEQNEMFVAGDAIKCNFWKVKIYILIKIPLKSVPECLSEHLIRWWHFTDDEPVPETSTSAWSSGQIDPPNVMNKWTNLGHISCGKECSYIFRYTVLMAWCKNRYSIPNLYQTICL